MGQVLLTNNAYTTLASGVASGDATITVTASTTFPSVLTASGNWFYACIQDTFANLEIVKVTNVVGTLWTVTRAIGGTSARAFPVGSVVELRVTAETLNDVTAQNVTTNLQNSTPQFLTGLSGADTLAATVPAPFTAYTLGQKFHFVATAANTGPATINLNALGAKAITKSGATTLGAGDIVAGGAYILIYDGTEFQLSGGAGGGASAGGVLYEAGTTISADYAVTPNKNALAIGGLSVATGKTLTLPTGRSLIVLGTGGSQANTYPALAGNNAWTGLQTFSQPVVAQAVPAFRAYQNTLQSVPTASNTRILLQAESFDPTNSFDSVTNFRFQPLVAGYYQISGHVAMAASTSGFAYLNKKGVIGSQGSYATSYAYEVNDLLQFDGVSDWVEMWVYQVSGGTVNTIAGHGSTYFSGILISRTS